jgi:uncharacterized membrane protein YhaH (DUF805 family)
MDWKNLYLSFDGRINRQPYWLGLLALMVVAWILEFAIFAAFGGSAMMAVDPNNPDAAAAAASSAMGAVAIPLTILILALLWPSLAIYTKRWHDRDKSGWWSLIMFVPIIGSLWMFIELGFLRGTEGPNRFGPDPLA